MTRRVKRPKDKEELLDDLKDKDKGGVFNTYKDVLLFAATLGALEDRFEPFENSSEPIDYSVFTNKSDNDALLYLLSLYKKKDITIFSDSNDEIRLEIFESYANAGLKIIQEKINQSTTQLDAILSLIYDAKEKTTQSKERDFSALISEIENF